jgi:hypothetical protein
MNPMEQAMISDMWTIELNCKEDEDRSDIRNVIVLIAGLQNIRVPEALVQSNEANTYQKSEGLLAFNQDGLAKFLTTDQMEVCVRKYHLLLHTKKSVKK